MTKADAAVRPLLLSQSDGGGGAARAAYRLHQALTGVGVESRMRVDFTDTDDPTVSRATKPWSQLTRRLRINGDQVPAVLAGIDDPGGFFCGLGSALTARQIDSFGADVINVHWTNFGFMSISQLGRITTPMVWTLHDMWAFTGGRSYDDEGPQARWRTGYETPPATPQSGRWDIEAWTYHRKQRHWRTPRQIVTPSRWLAGLARQSPLFEAWPVEVIPNALDTDIFRPREGARADLGLPPKTPLVLFALSMDLDDPRKGWDLLLGALRHLKATRPDAELMVMGQAQPPGDWGTDLPRTHWLGRIGDDDTLAKAYSAADVALVPSRQDNLPQTGTEAAACGTPVVAFDIGGLPDIVEHQTTGFLARPFDVQDLAQGIAWVLEDPTRREHLGRTARSRAVERWAAPVVAERYMSLFASARRP